MKKISFQLPQLFSSRIPSLYYGETAASRIKTEREARADQIFRTLQIVSHFLILLCGLVGFVFYKYYGLALGAMLGYVVGTWMRRSMGIRGVKPTTGFFKRMRERAQGSPPGMLEMLLERMDGYQYTQQQCKEVSLIYEKTVRQLRQAPAGEAQNRILADLDKRIRKILRG